MDILKKIVRQKRIEIAALKKTLKKKDLISACAVPRKIINFKNSIAKSGRLTVIGEIKCASPSAGVIKKVFDPVSSAQTYQKNGISALSVVTDKEFFKGKLEFIKLIKEKVNLPVLRKDFIIDEYQIYESYLALADAVLLIARLLSEKQLEDFLSLAGHLKLGALVEVHQEEDLKKALNCRAQVIGINNRDLETFKVNLNAAKKLAPLIPKEKIIVSESGLKTNRQLMNLKNMGVNAVLIGESFMRARDLEQKIKSLLKGII